MDIQRVLTASTHMFRHINYTGTHTGQMDGDVSEPLLPFLALPPACGGWVSSTLCAEPQVDCTLSRQGHGLQLKGVTHRAAITPYQCGPGVPARVPDTVARRLATPCG